MVSAGDALPHRAHEEDRPLHARAPRTDPQLFPRSEVALQWDCRGPEQQSQSHHEKILRIPHLPLSRTRALSLTWQITGAGINRGRDAGLPAPPAQIPTSGATA